MIDFRYHVVSLVAVLLALATGILVGSSVVQGPLLDSLTRTTDQLRGQTDDLQKDIQALERRERFGNAFGAQVAPQLVDGHLSGERVSVVSLPGASQDAVDATVQTLEQAGATVVSRVGVAPAFTNPDREAVLDDLVNQLAPPGTNWPDGSSVTDRAASLLAMGLVGPPEQDGPEPGDDDVAQIVPGLEAGEFISVAGDEPAGLAGSAVVVSGPTAGTDDAAHRATNTYLNLARALDKGDDGTVVAGPVESAADGGVVAAVRANTDAANVISTIDVVDIPIGRIGVVYALEEQGRGESGQYGMAGTTDGPLPDVTKEGES